MLADMDDAVRTGDIGGEVRLGAPGGAELIDENAPICPSCRRPMDLVIASWWCLDCQEAVHLDPA